MSRRPSTGNGGWTILESLIALTLGAAVAHIALQALLGTHELQEGMREEVDRLVVLRVARSAIAADLGLGLEGADWRGFPPDSVSLRAYRGVGLVCLSLTSGDTLYVRWQGVRLPNVRKDSVAVLGSNGRWEQLDLVDDRRVSSKCPADTTFDLRRWIVDPAPSAVPMVGRHWERGSYHVVDTVLSYRSRPRKNLAGSGSRQPITPGALRTPGTRFVDSLGGFHLLLTAKDTSWRRWTRLTGGAP